MKYWGLEDEFEGLFDGYDAWLANVWGSGRNGVVYCSDVDEVGRSITYTSVSLWEWGIEDELVLEESDLGILCY